MTLVMAIDVENQAVRILVVVDLLVGHPCLRKAILGRFDVAEDLDTASEHSSIGRRCRGRTVAAAPL